MGPERIEDTGENLDPKERLLDKNIEMKQTAEGQSATTTPFMETVLGSKDASNAAPEETFEERMTRLAQEGSPDVAPVGTLDQERERAARIEAERVAKFQQRVESDRRYENKSE